MSDRYAAPHDVPERQIDPPEHIVQTWPSRREWPIIAPRVGAGKITTLQGSLEAAIPLEGPEHDAPYTRAELRARIDESFDWGFKCGTEVHRCELRMAREARDALSATRSFYLQITLLVTISVVVMCSTWLLVQG